MNKYLKIGAAIWFLLVVLSQLGGCGFAEPRPSYPQTVCYSYSDDFRPEHLPDTVTYCEGEIL